MYVCVWGEGYMTLQYRSQLSALSGTPQVLSTLFWALSLACKSFIRPGWQANQLDRVPRLLPVATSLELGLSANHYAVYMCVLRLNSLLPAFLTELFPQTLVFRGLALRFEFNLYLPLIHPGSLDRKMQRLQ